MSRIPGKVIEVLDGYAGRLALVDVEGAQRKINIGMLHDPPAPETWVLIHIGFARENVDEVAAAEAMSGVEMMGRERDG